MKYFVIGDEDTVLGFGMVGVDGRKAVSSNDASRALEEALADEQVGIVLITERTAELIRKRVDELVFTEQFPLIVEIPDGRGKLEGKPDIRRTVNRAIGISV